MQPVESFGTRSASSRALRHSVGACLIGGAALIAAFLLLGAKRTASPVAGKPQVDGRSVTVERHPLVTFPGATVCRAETLVAAPAETVFQLVSDFRAYPSLFPEIREVQALGEGRYRWMFADPAAMPFSLDVSVRSRRSRRVLHWWSADEALFPCRGRIICRPLEHGNTRLEAEVAYAVPGGLFGHSMTQALGTDPHTAAQQSLDYFLARMRWEIFFRRHFAPQWRAPTAESDRRAIAGE